MPSRAINSNMEKKFFWITIRHTLSHCLFGSSGSGNLLFNHDCVIRTGGDTRCVTIQLGSSIGQLHCVIRRFFVKTWRQAR